MSVKDSRPPWTERVRDFVAPYTSEPQDLVLEIEHDVATGVLEAMYAGSETERIILLQIHNRTIEREEVFMGGVIFNDWLFKSLPRAVEAYGLGKALAITNDLETAYILIATSSTSEDVRRALRRQLLSDLPALFFGDDAPDRGLHGTFRRMHGILNSQREPFPVYAVPRFLAHDLERHVRIVLQELIAKPLVRIIGQWGSKQERRPSLDLRVIQTTMAYFYGRLSGGDYDCQSHDTFMTRLAFTYGLISPAELRSAYNLTSEQVPDTTSITNTQQRQVKDAVKESVRALTFVEDDLRAFLFAVLDRFGTAIDTSPDGADTPQPEEQYLNTWLLPYLRANGKLINMAEEDYLDAILHGIMVGTQTLALRDSPQGWSCRTCGEQRATIAECNILLGVAVNKFYNQLPNQKPTTSSERVCIRCALYSYLGTKLFGCTSAGSFPVPKQDNIIFHIGPHTQAEVRRIGQHMEHILAVARGVKQLRLEELSIEAVGEETKNRSSREQLIQRVIAKMAAGDKLTVEEQASLAEAFDYLAKEPTTLNILEQAAGCQVIDLGIGEEQRLVAFALPKLPGDTDLTQKRFARARLTVYALIGFLQYTCGCHQRGAYFFRTVPRLDKEFKEDVFYVEDGEVSGQQYRTRYRAAASFAIGVTKPAKDFTASWLRLSERLSDEPLETFSAVLRDTGYRVGDDRRGARYNVPETDGGVSYDSNMHVYGGWAYVTAFRSLHALWEDNNQKIQAVTELDESEMGV